MLATCKFCDNYAEVSIMNHLCESCMTNPLARAAHPSIRCNGRGRHDPNVPRGVRSYEPETMTARPTNPTPFRAGTYEKILVMAGRAERGEELFHALDGKCGRALEAS